MLLRARRGSCRNSLILGVDKSTVQPKKSLILWIGDAFLAPRVDYSISRTIWSQRPPSSAISSRNSCVSRFLVVQPHLASFVSNSVDSCAPNDSIRPFLVSFFAFCNANHHICFEAIQNKKGMRIGEKHETAQAGQAQTYGTRSEL